MRKPSILRVRCARAVRGLARGLVAQTGLRLGIRFPTHACKASARMPYPHLLALLVGLTAVFGRPTAAKEPHSLQREADEERQQVRIRHSGAGSASVVGTGFLDAGESFATSPRASPRTARARRTRNIDGSRTHHIRPITCLTWICLLYTSPSPRDLSTSRMPSSA